MNADDNLPGWARDTVARVEDALRTAYRERDAAVRALREFKGRESVEADGGTVFQYKIGDETFAIPDEADVYVNLGNGDTMELNVGVGGTGRARLIVDCGHAGISAFGVTGHSMSIGPI